MALSWVVRVPTANSACYSTLVPCFPSPHTWSIHGNLDVIPDAQTASPVSQASRHGDHFIKMAQEGLLPARQRSESFAVISGKCHVLCSLEGVTPEERRAEGWEQQEVGIMSTTLKATFENHIKSYFSTASPMYHRQNVCLSICGTFIS